MKGPLKLALVGLGNIGRKHLENMEAGVVTGAELAATCSPAPAGPAANIPHFQHWRALLAADIADAVVVATPTYTHVEIGTALLAAGKPLLMEKPLGLSVGDARTLVAAAHDGTPFAVMLNQRFDPAYARMKTLLEGGELGELVRVHWTMTQWYRPEIYYRVSRWRGTWPGEGGGVLLNQCIHNLDVLQWLTGMPARVHADVAFGKHHDIEVEDEVTAVLRYANGATASIVASTGEAPGINQLDVVCDRGTLRYDGSELRVFAADDSVAAYTRSTRDMFGVPDFRLDTQSSFAPRNQHALLLQNFVDAVRRGDELLTPASEGINSLELANAILHSAWTQTTVDLPLDVDEYQRRLESRIRESNLREAEDLDVEIDIDKSFR